MLTGMVIDTRVLSKDVVCSRETRKDAEHVLSAVLRNGVILTHAPSKTIREMVDATAELDSSLGQQLQIMVGELAANRKRYFSSMELPQTVCGLDITRQVALRLGADVVVCATPEDRDALNDLVAQNIGVVLPCDYPGCLTDRRRSDWLQAVRLDGLDVPTRENVLGRVVRYGRRVTIADKQIGLAAKGDRGGSLVRHLQGVAYIVDLWRRHSPYSDRETLELELISVAGMTGARAGFVDPATARENIRAGLARVGVRAQGLSVVLKQDTTPSIFNDRFLEVKGRCWGVRHGIDCFGELGSSESTRPAFIDPASVDNATLLGQIRALHDA